MSPPVGPTGLPTECDGSAPPTWQITGAVSGFSTTIDFDGARLSVEQLAATATVGRFATPRLGWTATAGGIVAGQIDGRDVTGGATLAAAVSWLPVYERRRRPFVGLTATLGAAFARAPADDGMARSWWAFDLRGGVTVGKTLAERWVPYVSARGFGGPVLWHRGGERVVGSDRYHVTLGAGLIVRMPRNVDLALEIMPVGEQSAALGVTAHL